MPIKADRLAHRLGIAGFVLALASLGWQVFSYFDNRAWQRSVYQERVIGRVSLQHTVQTNESPWSLIDKENGTINLNGGQIGVSIEVVNIGQQPVYLSNVSIDRCKPLTHLREGRTFYERNMNDPADRGLKLEPGVSKTFWIKKWDYDAIPVLSSPDEQSEYCVVVASTKGEILRSPVEVHDIETITAGRVPKQRGHN